MLFQSQVPAIFTRMGIDFSNATNAARRELSAKALDLYHSEGLKHLETRLSELFSEPEKLTKLTINVLRKIIHQQAQTYREPPTRTIEGTETDQNLFSQICEDCSLDIVLKQSSRYLKLLKSLLLKVIWDGTKVRLDIVTGNQIIDIRTGNTPYDLESILIVDYGQTERPEDVEFSLWEKESWSRLDWHGNTIEQLPNPYNGSLPFVPLFDSYNSTNSFFLPMDDSLISLQEAINLQAVSLQQTIFNQSWGVGYLKSSSPGGGNLRVDVGSLVELPTDGEIGFVSQKAQIDAAVNALDKTCKWACISAGLSAAHFSTDASEASGLSKLVDRSELNEIRQDDIALFRSYERQLFKILKIVFNAHASKKLSEASTLSLNYSDPRTETDPKTRAEADDLRIAQGTMSPVDVILRDPDMQGDREKALAYLLTIKSEIEALTE